MAGRLCAGRLKRTVRHFRPNRTTIRRQRCPPSRRIAFGAAANDADAAGNARVARRAVGGHRLRRRRARPLPARAADRPGAPGRHRRAVLGQHRLRQHDPDRPGRAHPRQHRDRGAPARLHALERDGDGGQGEPPASGRRRRPRRPHLELRLAGDDVRHRLQPLLARRDAPTTAATCSTSRATRRRASTRAPTSKAGSARSSCSTSARRSTARASRAIRIPKLMPEFWQFPTVSMGLGPLMAIYQARFLKYLHARGIADTAKRKVWVFCGDGEMDEPESLGAIGLAAREKLDNLIFVINCNLQRLDGPVRGNGKIIQELESEFRGSGWNVIKLIWGSYWDPLLARDKDGTLRKVMMETVDGDYQAMKANDGAFVRKHFFGQDPKLLEMVAKMSDEDIWRLQPRRPRSAEGLRRVPSRRAPRRASRRCCSSRPSRASAWARAARARTPRTRPRSWSTRTCTAFRDRWNIPDPRRQARRHPVLQAGRRHAGDEVPARAPRGARRLPAAAPRARPTSSSRCRRSTPSRRCSSRPPKAARSRRRRPSCAS